MAKPSWFKLNIYNFKVVINVIGLILGTSYMSFLVMRSFVVSGTLVPGFEVDPVYVLDSSSTRKQLDAYGVGSASYEARLSSVKNIIQNMGGVPLPIYEDGLKDLSPSSRLFVIDAISLSQQAVEEIELFVQHGGSLMFNFNSGFTNENGEHRGTDFISKITGLKPNNAYPKIEKQEGLFFTTKVLSPLTEHIPQGRRLNLVTYDDIPLFDSGVLEADAVLTDWAKTSTPVMPDGYRLSIQESGVLWHGFHGKGRWVYFNFPSYSFYEVAASSEHFTNLMQGIIDFAYKPAIIRKFPYINTDKAVMVSEDTEYKYENLANFAKLAEKYKIHTTAFCVATLADEHRKITMESQKNPYVEIASHSYDHHNIMGEPKEVIAKQIGESKSYLEEIIQDKVYGFRPPREEIDVPIADALHDARYAYVFEKNKEVILPYHEYEAFLTIPRTGTDDYLYFISLDWDSDTILKNILRERELINYLGGLYTLSTHTHLLSYQSNIKILEEFFKALKEMPEVATLSGKQISDTADQNYNLVLKVDHTSENLLISVKNGNRKVIENFKFRLYWQGARGIRTITSEIFGTDFDYTHNVEEHYTDVTIHNLKPQSALIFMAPYLRHEPTPDT